MDQDSFNGLVTLLEPSLQRQDTVMREAIPVGERLAITLRYLATGHTSRALEYSLRVSRHSISKIVIETCEKLYNVLQPNYIKVPSTIEEWNNIATRFEEKWNFPHCIGALDGKHISIQPPPNSGSHYFNYKGFNSIVLLALADADLTFIYIDVGTNGRVSDGGVWAKCGLSQALEQNKLNIPPPKELPGRQLPVPFAIVADEAFGLKPWLMRPYPRTLLDKPKQIFNYRLSRARRCVENVFGVLANRFRVFRKSIPLEPSKTIIITHTRYTYTPLSLVDHEDTETSQVICGTWRQEPQCLQPIAASSDRHPSVLAKEVREEFCSYFNANGAVSWQDNSIQ
ncbi:hypothetical protein ACEWY4_001303 [Coilia grayii]|uniref:DDE Tnp4 domain-containing protein n=1 Tax=Coilia grayii TaxID=363190 RepID=A0ABD1KSL6_9TELE